MSYIHEALVKAQKERNGHLPKDSVNVAESSGITAKSSLMTLAFLFILISVLVAITIYSWFKPKINSQILMKEKSSKEISDVVANKKKDKIINEKEIKTEKIANLNKKKLESLKDTNKQKKKLITQKKEKKLTEKQSIEDELLKNNKENAITYKAEKREQEQLSKKIEENEFSNNMPLGPDQFIEVSRLYKKGLELQIQKKYEKAIVYYQKCLDISPHMAPALNNMGVILLKKKEYEEAQNFFFTAIKESPAYVDPYYNLACLFSQIKKSTKAIEYLKKAVRLSEEARNWAITDKDFEPLYELPEFNMIIAGYDL